MKKTICILILLTMCLTGCSEKKSAGNDRQNVDFTVVTKSEIPSEIMTLIDEKKSESFQISSVIEGYTYLAVGYGVMPTGGYSIKVDELYMEEDKVVIKTSLMEPSGQETVNRLQTYPYIVVKIQYTDKNIIFK